MKYARAVVERQARGLAALQPVADAGESRIGLAWMTTQVSGRTLTWRNGGTGGYRSMLALDRATGQAVLVLNSSKARGTIPGCSSPMPHLPPNCKPPHYLAMARVRWRPSSSVWCCW